MLDREDLAWELGEATVRDGLVFVTVSYYEIATDLYTAEAAVAVIDAETDEVLDVALDDRCGQVEELLQSDDGTIYLATNTFGSFAACLAAARGFPGAVPIADRERRARSMRTSTSLFWTPRTATPRQPDQGPGRRGVRARAARGPAR